MYWKDVAIALATLPAVIEAHGAIVGPKLVGRRSVEELKARNAFALRRREAQPAPLPAAQPVAGLNKRQNTDGQCGAGFGACAAGYCCSDAGWCGQGSEYCAAPNCQFKYGPGCDTLKVPSGPKTSNVPRIKVGSVPYGGGGVYNCINSGQVAITYDDGPAQYTSHILDLLDRYNAKATFFITGNNIGKGPIDSTSSWVADIRRMDSTGHQIASHTWGHQDLSRECNQAQRKDQMYYNEMAFNNILGFFPTYMRPPYSSCDSTTNGNCENDMAALGYHVIYFDLDTEDYLLDDVNLIQQAKNDFSGNITASHLAIAHDIHYQTAYNLTEFMLQTLQSQGYKAVTVGECLGDPRANWYRAGPSVGGGSSSLSVSSSTRSSSASKSSSVVSTTRSSPVSSVVPSSSPKPSSSASSKPSSLSLSSKPTSNTSFKPSSTSQSLSKPVSSSFSSSKPISSSKSSAKPPSGSSSRPSPTSSGATKPTVISTDATCGGAKGYTCQGSAFGNCCSVNGWCGSNSDYCGSGCQSAFGTCGTQSNSAPAPSSTGTKGVSQDGTCGAVSGFTCQGSEFGNCCSQHGWCGSTSGHCSTGCQPAFGTCSK